jgi:Icc-related predicted phosphoesterase
MAKIAYVTDLHLNPGSGMLRTLTDKIRALPSDVRGICVGGDTFALKKEHWPKIIGGSLSAEETRELISYSFDLIDEVLPATLEAAGERPVIMIPGNADYIGYSCLVGNKQDWNGLHLIDTKKKDLFDLHFAGVGGAKPNNADSNNIANNNPWYFGIQDENSFRYRFAVLSAGTDTSYWANTVLMTHMPALGYIDSYRGEHQGDDITLDFINRWAPLLHLAGHVHDGPMASGKYLPFDVINEKTLTVNPGGGALHNDGIKMIIVDLEQLADLRSKGMLNNRSATDVLNVI